MKQLTVENYRCFHRKQNVPLAPLTLLVGENSTGKTSILAIIRILFDSLFSYDNLNFKNPPFDLGSFDDIAYRPSEKSNSTSSFEAGIDVNQGFRSHFVFKENRTIPRAVQIQLNDDNTWIESYDDDFHKIQIGTPQGVWEIHFDDSNQTRKNSKLPPILGLYYKIIEALKDWSHESPENIIPINESPAFSVQDMNSILNANYLGITSSDERLFVCAPVRSKPQRTYDQAGWIPDPDGYFAPMFLANTASYDSELWKDLKYELERFGTAAGMFDEIEIKRLGESGSDPFQILVRKFYNQQKGSKQNLIDVGYGVSQVLPILTELLLSENSYPAMLQQPEVHLHPKAQAALGSLFCEIAGQGKQLIVETHSEFILDRIRMDIRDQKTDLTPEDVIILFFERNDASVEIHPIHLDELGNVLNAPDSYGGFFMEESSRSLGF